MPETSLAMLAHEAALLTLGIRLSVKISPEQDSQSVVRTGSISITWRLARNANSNSHPLHLLNQKIEVPGSFLVIFVLISTPSGSDASACLRIAGLQRCDGAGRLTGIHIVNPREG